MIALTQVQTKTREKRETRKQLRVEEAIHDPETAAKEESIETSKDKQRKKRQVEERRANRGVMKKKPQYVVCSKVVHLLLKI